MDKERLIKKIEDRAFDARITIGELCKKAGVAPSTFSRWKKNPSTMRPGTVAKLEKVLDDAS